VLWNLPQIGVPVDILFYIPFGDPNGFPVTNTLLVTWLTIIVLLAFFWAATRHPRLIPKGVQNLVEWVFQMLLNLCEEVAGRENGRRFFPWVATIFLFVLLANWWEIVPGVESLGTVEPGVHNASHFGPIYFLFGPNSNRITPWLRPPSTDLNLTIAIAIVSVVMTQVYGFRQLGGFQHITRYLNYREGLLGIIVGVLEAVLEAARIISFSFRLFGNLFAGDVLLLVMAFLVPFVGATLFYFLEVFVGFIQAFVFAMLTLVFMTLAVTPHEHHEEHQEEHTQTGHAAPAAVESPTAA
jgi:F-type H+-transporting ATPase subunit a